MTDPLILTPDQMRMIEFKKQLEQILNKYSMKLIPVVQIVGAQLTSGVDIIPANNAKDIVPVNGYPK